MAALCYWDGTQWVQISDLTVYTAGAGNPWVQILIPIAVGDYTISSSVILLDAPVLTSIDKPS